jgi:hypothetical protein
VPTCFSLMEACFSRTEVVFYQATQCWIPDSSLHENAGHHKMQEVPLSDACHPQKAVVKVCVTLGCVLFVMGNCV